MFILLMKQISKILNQNFLIILIYCNCIIGKLNSQTFYSKTYTRDSGFHYFSGLAAYDDCFYVLSHYSDPEVKNRYGATALLKFDWGGNILQLDSLPPKDGKSFAWPNDLEVIDDSLLFFVAQDTNYLFSIEFNRKSRRFSIEELTPVINPYFYNDAIGVHQANDFSYFAKYQGNRQKRSSSIGFYNRDLILYSLKFGHQDTAMIIEGEYSLNPYSISINRIGNLYVGGLLTDWDYDDSTDYTFRQFIYEFDTSLQLIRKILSPVGLKLGSANAIVEDREGNIYCAGSDVIWHLNQEFMVNNYYNEIPAISKYNAHGVYQWSKRLPFPDKRGYDNYYNLIFSSDSNSLISVGTYFYSDSLYWDDSTYSSIDLGVITKINLEGDEQWTRLYSARGVGRQTSWSRFNDIIQSPSGGYLICGSNRLSYKQVVNEAGWLMKVDEFGCYIPGCHILNTVSDEKKIKLQLYPNPAHDHFAIIHNYEESLNCKMYTLDGVFVTKFDDIFPLETQIVDLGGLKSGEYLLQFFSQDGKWVGTKKLVVL